MKKIVLLLLAMSCLIFCSGQDVFTRGLVYQVSEMKKVIIKEKITYRSVNDTALRFDIYYPPSFSSNRGLPLVVFNNGVVNKDTVTNLPSKRAHHELVYDVVNKIILMTAGSTPLNGGTSFEVFNDIWSFDGKAWKLSGTAGDKRSGVRMAYDTRRNKLFSFGGWSNGNSLAELRVLENGEWKILSNIPEMKASEPGFVYDAQRDRLIAFGGSAAMGVVNNITWEWDGDSWEKFNGAGPEGRQAFAMIYDSRRKRTVLYGGMGTSLEKSFGDTWEFDGKHWMLISGNGPGPRRSPGYTYDSKRGVMIIFGGNMNKMLNDTWSWDGKEWKKLSDAGPPARAMGYMSYDKNRDKVVMFGGRLGWPNDANDTWEWDGKEWKEIK